MLLNAASYTWKETSKEGDCAYLHYGEIHTKYHDHLNLKSSDLPYISCSQARNFTKLQNGDLVMLNASEDYEGVNDCVEIENCDKDLVAGQHTIPLRPTKDKFEKGFIGYIPSIPIVRNQIVENAVGTKVYGVTNEMLKAIFIPIPTKVEQRRIATALSNVDALIAAVEKKIEKKKLIKQGAMQQLLTGKKRLPGFNGKWEIKQLGQIGKFTKGAGISRSESQSGKLPAIRYGEIYTDHNDYIREFKTFISDEVANRSRQIHYGDILFTASGETKEDIGKSVAFVNNYKAFAGGDIIIMSPKEEYDPIYMGYITNCRYVQEQKSSKGQGDAVVHIVTADISSVRIPFAPLSEQRAIASILSNMDSEITALERKRDKLKELKQGMMQQLLTGKIRLVRCSG